MKPCYRLEISGLVQGVGFRPFVFNIAKTLGLTGRVFNAGKGVIIEVISTPPQLDDLLHQLKTALPSLAKIDQIEQTVLPELSLKNTGFIIDRSDGTNAASQIMPDLALCQHCLVELFDPKNSRYRYPLINCTQCGPRYSIIKSLPYDRPATTMSKFAMCAPCSNEYHDPGNRRFHAQPIACNDCGPQVQLLDPTGKQLNDKDAFKLAAQFIQDGKIIAIKGIGGFHLACDASNAHAVKRLRKRKHRPSKPLAVMASNLASLKKIVQVNEQAGDLLSSFQAPIVILPSSNVLPETVAPGLNQLGVILAYTPIQHLLFHELLNCPKDSDWFHQANSTYLVMTSANQSGNPLIASNEQALSELSDIADYFLLHNRDIYLRGDDSIINGTLNGDPVTIRRARGMAPQKIKLASKGPSVIALGSQLKNSFCITRDDQAFVSQFIGDLDNPGNRLYLQQTLLHLEALLNTQPQAVVTDLHPDFFGLELAKQLASERNIPLIQVQHHQAHAASVVAENLLQNDVIAVTLDGLGYGNDNTLWGGELLQLDADATFTRLGSFNPLKMPGGDMASRQPWRMAMAFLLEHNEQLAIEKYKSFSGYDIIQKMVVQNLNCPNTSSAGRLFDVAASLLNISHLNEFEAESAMLLEATAGRNSIASIPQLFEINDQLQLDLSPLLLHLSQLDCSNPAVQIEGARLFHYVLANAVYHWVIKACQNTGIQQVVLSGGCWLNGRLNDLVMDRFRQSDIKVYQSKTLSPNDSGLSLGQALLGQQLLASG